MFLNQIFAFLDKHLLSFLASYLVEPHLTPPLGAVA